MIADAAEILRDVFTQVDLEKMLFRMESEIPPVMPIRLQVEINCFEHFNELGLVKVPFEVENSWFSGKCDLTTYQLDELTWNEAQSIVSEAEGARFVRLISSS